MKNQHKTSFSQPEAVRKHFEDHSGAWRSVYDERNLHAQNIQTRRERVLEYVDRLGLPEGSAALDLGCGAGLVCADLLGRGYRVFGLDVAQNMIDLAQKHCAEAGYTSGIVLQVGDAEALEFEDDTFDLIIAMGLVEYITWDRWALQEMHRVLKPGGHLIVTAPNRVRISELVHPLRWLRRGIRSLQKKIFRKTAPSTSSNKKKHSSSSKTFERHLYRPVKFDRMLARLGYEILASDSHGFGPFPMLRRSNQWTLRVNDLLQNIATRRWIPYLHRLGGNYNVLCRKEEDSTKTGGESFFLDVDHSIHIFRKEYRKAFSRLKQWLKEHPQYSSPQVRGLDSAVKPGDAILVLSPHPDDEIIGCGGSLLKMKEAGARITIAMLTDGAETRALKEIPEETRHTVRIKEAREVAEILGANFIAWGEPDSKLVLEPRNIERLVNLLEELQPKLVFVPFVNDFHPDHIAINRILSAALKQASLELNAISILAYEVWAFVPVNLVHNIDSAFHQKTKLLRKYRTGMKVKDYVRFCRSLNAYYAFTKSGRKGYTEGFFSLPADEYIALIEE